MSEDVLNTSIFNLRWPMRYLGELDTMERGDQN